jgi:hypothetical protein
VPNGKDIAADAVKACSCQKMHHFVVEGVFVTNLGIQHM